MPPDRNAGLTKSCRSKHTRYILNRHRRRDVFEDCRCNIIFPGDSFFSPNFYQKAIGFTPSAGEHQTLGVLPQYYADMFGWRGMGAKGAAVYLSVPPPDRAPGV